MRKILSVTEAQPYGFVKLRGRRIADKAREMRDIGLVELSAATSRTNPDVVVTKSVTNAGRKFLRVVGDRQVARCIKRVAESAALLPEPEMEVSIL